MKYLLEEANKTNWEEISQKNILLCLDFDGTLSPLVPSPEEAVLPSPIRDTLVRVINKPRIKAAVISGRSLEDVKQKIGLEGIIYIGNHGFESDDGYLCDVNDETRKSLDTARNDWREIERKFENSYFQDKNITLSLHFKKVAEEKLDELRGAIFETFQSWQRKDLLHLSEGKKVFELRPNVDCHKGTAMRYLHEQYPGFYPIYIGDDVTDEDAFRFVQKCGLGIRVGFWDKSCAEYYIRGQDEIITVLQELLMG